MFPLRGQELSVRTPFVNYDLLEDVECTWGCDVAMLSSSFAGLIMSISLW